MELLRNRPAVIRAGEVSSRVLQPRNVLIIACHPISKPPVLGHPRGPRVAGFSPSRKGTELHYPLRAAVLYSPRAKVLPPPVLGHPRASRELVIGAGAVVGSPWGVGRAPAQKKISAASVAVFC